MTRSNFSAYAGRLREFILRSSDSDRARSPSAPLATKVPRTVRGVLGERALPPAQTEEKSEFVGQDDEVEKEFKELALVLFNLQFASNPAYRAFCQMKGAARDQISHWTQIPAMPAAGFKEMNMTSLEPGERTAVFHSSGTTAEKRSAHFHNEESLAIYEASLLPWFAAHLLGEESARQPGGESRLQMLFLTPAAEAAPHSSLAHMFECVRREFGGPGSTFTGHVDATWAWTLDLARTRAELVRAAEANTPIALFGTAFNFVHLLEYLAVHSLSMPLSVGSRVMETGGYKGRSRAVPKAELHALLARRLGVRLDYIISEYGMSELSSQAYDRAISGTEPRVSAPAALRVFRFPPWARAQVISPESGREVEEGETGLIRVYDLANVRSVLAIQTEDLGIRRGGGYELIGRASLAEPRGCSLMVA